MNFTLILVLIFIYTISTLIRYKQMKSQITPLFNYALFWDVFSVFFPVWNTLCALERFFSNIISYLHYTYTKDFFIMIGLLIGWTIVMGINALSLYILYFKQ
jgi:hypothetical protein